MSYAEKLQGQIEYIEYLSSRFDGGGVQGYLVHWRFIHDELEFFVSLKDALICLGEVRAFCEGEPNIDALDCRDCLELGINPYRPESHPEPSFPRKIYRGA